MVQAIIVIAGLLAFETYSFFKPILIPPEYVDGVKEILSSIWLLEGIVPAEQLINAFCLILSVLVLKFLWKLAIGILALVSGSGQPDID